MSLIGSGVQTLGLLVEERHDRPARPHSSHYILQTRLGWAGDTAGRVDLINVLHGPEPELPPPEDRFILFSLPSSLAILWRPSVGVFLEAAISTRHSPA